MCTEKINARIAFMQMDKEINVCLKKAISWKFSETFIIRFKDTIEILILLPILDL